ncbi:MAG: hypothetical protein RBU29_14010 [bacterium]|jgi:uncharacterized membrane protein|nr:hypothetical protein [bacterium]
MREVLDSLIPLSDLADLSQLRFGFHLIAPLGLAVVVLFTAALLTSWFYWTRLHPLRPRIRGLLTGLRILLVLLLLFLCMDPGLTGNHILPGEQHLLLLFDDSQSMQITHSADQTRGQRLQTIYNQTRQGFAERLQRRFQLHTFAFGPGIESIPDINTLKFQQSETAIHAAISQAIQEFPAENLAGVVLFSDGVEQSVAPSASFPSGIPIHTVGIPDPADWRDIRVGPLTVTRTHFDRSPVTVLADLQADNLAGQRVQIDILDQGIPVHSQTILIESNHHRGPVRLEWLPARDGWLAYEVRASVQAQEDPGDASFWDRVPQNNSRTFVIDNNPKEYRVLFFSGKPNWEHKFVRRALADEPRIRMESLILLSKAQRQFTYRGARTTTTNPLFDGFENDQDRYGRYDEPIFLRMGMQEHELTSGYPAQAEELFPYDLVIWSDLDPDTISSRQMKVTREFVERRGGAFFLLADAASFAPFSLAGTEIEPILPVVWLQNLIHESAQTPSLFSVTPTQDGEISGIWALETSPEASRQAWDTMPPLFGLTQFPVSRAGAQVGATAQTGSNQEHPFFATQRYGKGKSAILATGESWLWQMHTPSQNSHYERLWRQWVRSLVHDVPGPIQFRVQRDTLALHERAPFAALVHTLAYDPQENAPVQVEIRPPSLTPETPPVTESLHEPGLYGWEFTPAETGLHHLRVTVPTESEDSPREAERAFWVEPDHREFASPQADMRALEALAQHSGGLFVPLDDLPTLADRIPYTPTHSSATTHVAIWHWPLFYWILMILFTLDWYLRRKQGQP